MHFDLVDRVIEQSEDRIVTVKVVTAGEEYLQDHFATFPVLPGVLMLEAMVQAARRLAEHRAGAPQRLVLGRVRVLKYGRFVRPGATLRVEVNLGKPPAADEWDFRAEAKVLEPPGAPGADGEPGTAASGRFSLRPVRVGPVAVRGAIG